MTFGVTSEALGSHALSKVERNMAFF